MIYLNELIHNHILWAATFSWLVSQLLKVMINLIVQKKFVLERLWGDGGMPSGHSATVTALAGMCGWCYGFDSAIFAIAAILMIIVTHDASGVRREAGKHAVSIKLIAEVLNHISSEDDEEIRTEKLKEMVGHTPLQVFFGVVIGILMTIVYCFATGVDYCAMIAG